MPLSCASFWQGVHFTVQNAFNNVLLSVHFFVGQRCRFQHVELCWLERTNAFCTFYYQGLEVCLVHRARWLLELMIMLQCFDYASFEFTTDSLAAASNVSTILTMLFAAHSFFETLVSAALAATLRGIFHKACYMIADSTQEHNVGLVQERTCPAPARLGSSEHKNTENQLKRVSSLKIFPPAAGQPAALRATLFTKKHIHSLQLLGARPRAAHMMVVLVGTRRIHDPSHI